MCAQPHIPQTSPPAHHLEPWLTAGQTGQLLLLLIPPPQGHKPTLAEAFTSSFLKEWEEGQNSATLLSHRALIKFLCQICLHIKKINFFCLLLGRYLGYTQISQAISTGGAPGSLAVPSSSLAALEQPLLSFLVPAAARLPSARSQSCPAQPTMAHLNGTGSFSAPHQPGLG